MSECALHDHPLAEGTDATVKWEIEWVDPFDIELIPMPGLEVEPWEPEGVAQYPMVWPPREYLDGYGDTICG